MGVFQPLTAEYREKNRQAYIERKKAYKAIETARKQAETEAAEANRKPLHEAMQELTRHALQTAHGVEIGNPNDKATMKRAIIDALTAIQYILDEYPGGTQ